VKNPPIKSKKKGVLSWRIHERGVSKSWTEVNHKHNRNPKQPNNFWSTSLNENVINDLIRLKKCRQKIFINSDHNYMIITRLISKSSRHAASLSWISSPLLQVVCWVYDQSPTLARNGKDHGYIRMDKYLYWYEAFWV
jgi:hypothetical protein